jgi:hypothetical protein
VLRGHQLSVISYQLSAISHQPSAISYQLAATTIGHQSAAPSDGLMVG